MTIYKYTLAVTDVQIVLMPINSEILSVQMQHGFPCLWALVEPSISDKEARTIEIFGTGNPMEHCRRKFIGTVQQFNGQLVWHVFERL